MKDPGINVLLHLRYGAEPDVLACGCEGGLGGLVGGHEAVDGGPELGGVVEFAEVG